MSSSNSRSPFVALAIVAICAAAACHVEDPSDRAIESDGANASGGSVAMQAGVADGTAVTPVSQTAGGPREDWATVQSRVLALVDSTDRMLRKVPALTRWEKVKLRRDVNRMQIARARQLGIVPGSDPEALLKNGTLVRLADNTPYWTLYNLNYSVPYVRPSTEELLVQIAERFQAKLDSIDCPRYRLVITSVLRTADKQAALRRANANASKIQSAHEFGTTVDIAYRRFAAPVDPTLDAYGAMMADSLMSKAANLRSAELQAILGRVLADLEREGKVMVMMERQQTVYHITIGKALPHPRHIPAI
jgi:hypothetical protein